jgi:hypothetical protein
MTILKAIGAILAGFIFIAITHTVTDKVLESAGVIPGPEAGFMPHWVGAVALAYRTILTVAGGYLCAMIAPAPKMRYVMILGALGTLGGIGGIVANAQLNMGPVWYPVALAALAFPSVWLGGNLRVR